MDLSESFITIKRNEMSQLENQVKKLTREKEQLLIQNELLTSENRQLRKIMPQNNTAHTGPIKTHNAGDIGNHDSTFNFIQRQGHSNLVLNVMSPPHSTAGKYGSVQQNLENINKFSNLEFIDSESSNLPPVIGYDMRRNSVRDPNVNKSAHNQEFEDDNLAGMQTRVTNYDRSLPNVNTNSLTSLTKEMKITDNPSILLKTLLREWNRRPLDMTRVEFFYRLMTIFIENGINVTYCTEHSPPCKPRANCRMFEKNAQVLKSFILSINKSRQLVIEVELLLALESLIYFQPKFRPAMSDILDILYRKGVIEAAAFGEWSEIDNEGREQKKLLLREIKSSGFSLLKRSSSL